jgi:hypothetical protein
VYKVKVEKLTNKKLGLFSKEGLLLSDGVWTSGALTSSADFVNAIKDMKLAPLDPTSFDASEKADVQVSLQFTKTSTGKTTTVADLKKSVTVVKKDLNEDDFDGYAIYVNPLENGWQYTEDVDAGGVSQIYTGVWDSANDKWAAGTTQPTMYFAVSAAGLINGDENEYALDGAADLTHGYKATGKDLKPFIKDSLGLVEDGELHFSAKDVKGGLAGQTDTISLYLGAKTEPVYSIDVTFAADEPVATSIDPNFTTDKPYKYNWSWNYNESNNSLKASDFAKLLTVRDQYGVRMYDAGTPAVTMSDVKTNVDNPKYTVYNDGNAGFEFKNNESTDETKITPLGNGDKLVMDVDFGAPATATVTVTLTDAPEYDLPVPEY